MQKTQLIGWTVFVLALCLSLVIVGKKLLDRYLQTQLQVLASSVSNEVSGLSESLVTFEADLLSLKSEVKGAKTEDVVQSVSNSEIVAEEEPNTPSSDSVSGNNSAGLININSASLSQLMSLPGIGQSYARRIIEGRPYSSVNELTKVKGIGPKTLEKIKNQIAL